MKMKLLGVLFVIFNCLLSTSLGIAASQLDSLTIGYSSFSADYVPLWTAVEDRLGKKYGLDLNAVYAGRIRPQQLPIAVNHDGPTVAGNLALSCFHDNSHKGSNLAGRDPKTRKLTPLFNPRRHKWERHFRWRGAYLIGRTPVGCVTVAVLNINDPLRVELREGLIEEGLFPPA